MQFQKRKKKEKVVLCHKSYSLQESNKIFVLAFLTTRGQNKSYSWFHCNIITHSQLHVAIILEEIIKMWVKILRSTVTYKCAKPAEHQFKMS